MKTLFMLALLGNMVFFLWEYNIGSNSLQTIENRVQNTDNSNQIILLSEQETEKNKEARLLAKKEKIFTVAVTDLLSDKRGASKLKPMTQPMQKQSGLEIKTVSKKDLKKVKSVKKAILNNPVIPTEIIPSPPITIKMKSTTSVVPMPKKQQLDEIKLTDKEQVNSLSNKVTEVKKELCFQVGPFLNAAKLNRWVKRNSIAKELFKTVSKERKKSIRHLVYYPAESTFSQSKANIKILRKKGVKDYWIFRKGELKGAISLGVFRREKGALFIQNQMIKKGLDVKIKQRFKTETVLFAQVSTNNQKFKQSVKILKKQTLSECKRN